MKFARLGAIGHEKPVVITDGITRDISSISKDIDGDFFNSAGPARVATALNQLPIISNTEQLRIGAPLAKPGAIICIGMNYAAHAAETGAKPPALPIIFLKAPNTLAGPNDQVTIPRNSNKTDWEVELGVVIGKRASYLYSVSEAKNYIAGYVLCNDVSEREFQMELSGGQWSKGKIAPGFNPAGPWLVTADEIDSSNLQLRSWVNGEPRQNSNTNDLIFNVPYIVHHLSQFMTLDPGDLILTGTPEGVAVSGRFPYLKAGDVVEVEIEHLGRQRQEFIDWTRE